MESWQIIGLVLLGVVTFLSAVGVYIDSKKLGIEKYKKTALTLSTTPLGAAFVVFIFWPIAFPIYISWRWRAINGKISLNETNNKSENLDYIEDMKINDFKVLIVVSFFIGLIIDILLRMGFFISVPLSVISSFYLVKILNIKRDSVVYLISIMCSFLLFSLICLFWKRELEGEGGILFFIGAPISIIFGILIGNRILRKLNSCL